MDTNLKQKLDAVHQELSRIIEHFEACETVMAFSGFPDDPGRQMIRQAVSCLRLLLANAGMDVPPASSPPCDTPGKVITVDFQKPRQEKSE